jgi:predicted enzyme related to lactoylglutathione lyase
MGNPVVHWELMVGDLENAKAFYRSVFDWKIDDSGMPGYASIDTGSRPPGGMMARPESVPVCALNTYFAVDDIDSTLAKALAAGGSLIAPKTPVPGIGAWAMFTDPDGIPIGVFQAG